MASAATGIIVQYLLVGSNSVGIVAVIDRCCFVVAPGLQLSALPGKVVVADLRGVAYGVIGYGR